MLTSKQRQHLKTLAHSLKPIINIGKRGYTESLLLEIDSALLSHELIKVKFLETALTETDTNLMRLCQELKATQVELRGHVAILYRAHPEKARIKL
jgi:RNA-binding protein